ncbi:hypothetical protein [Alteribacillus bidgolensis]|uniref:Uncharacterized protein n=1 Tax=Alteribacillus bidgolensis TaxID=930129 RepID=A0A1G8L3V9_9BACI|nr:hypothetical protein [Alteribacillus bidgolensis]SDI50393.1 hypothetical protein SAMN05216352_108143 [Alteribacillus bidgolensis]
MRHSIIHILLSLSLIANIVMGVNIYYQSSQSVGTEKIDRALIQMGYDLAAAIKFSTFEKEEDFSADFHLMKAQQLLDNMLTLSENTSDASVKAKIIHNEIKQWESYIFSDQPYSIKQMDDKERRQTGDMIGKAFSSESANELEKKLKQIYVYLKEEESS